LYLQEPNRLIDQCGLKGTRVGGAEVSAKHANFIINSFDASFSDVMGLIAMVRERVQEEFDARLELEVHIFDEFGNPMHDTGSGAPKGGW